VPQENPSLYRLGAWRCPRQPDVGRRSGDAWPTGACAITTVGFCDLSYYHSATFSIAERVQESVICVIFLLRNGNRHLNLAVALG